MPTMQEYNAHKKALKAQIKETKALLAQLERELEDERVEMQHEEVEHLEEYMDKTQLQFEDIKILSTNAMGDFRRSMNDLVSWFRGNKK